MDPVPYHVINIALHTIATVFVYLICVELAIPLAFSLLAAGLFAVHPIHTEAVDWIAATPEVACAAFFFAAFWAYLRSKEGANKNWLYASALLLFPALLSKEMAITLPALVLLTTIRQPWPLSRRIHLMIPYAAVVAVYLVMRIYALGFLATEHTPLVMPYLDWITLAIHIFGRYIWFALVPYPLNAYHQVPTHLADRVDSTLIALIPIALGAGFAWMMRKRLPQIPLWCAAFALMLVPVFYLKGISTAVMADRYLYIPSLAVVIILATLLASLLPKQGLWIGWALVALFATGSILRNRDWQDAEHIYTATLERDPEVAVLQINLAEVLLLRGDDTNAASRLNLALASLNRNKYQALPDEYYRVHVGLGAILARAKRYPEAREHLEYAHKLVPNNDWPYLYLGGISMEADNDLPKAIEQFQTAIRLGPLNEVARDYLGIAYFNQGRFAEAKAAFEEAMKINPTNKEVHAHLEMANRELAK
jgi:Flp pilus assembly protein TadD